MNAKDLVRAAGDTPPDGARWPQNGAAPTLAVTITLVVTIDVDAWRLAYGDTPRATIADDVRGMVIDAARDGGTFAPDAGVIDARAPYRARRR